MSERYIVVDTNVLISAALFDKSATARVLRRIAAQFTIVQTERTWAEFQDTFDRGKFDRFLAPGKRGHFSRELIHSLAFIESRTVVTDCRDPKDNKFLALALDAPASHIVTGDKDLLVLNPYRGITICNPAGFLAEYPG